MASATDLQTYVARETARGGCRQRSGAGFCIDFVLVSVLRKLGEYVWKNYVPHAWEPHTLANLPHHMGINIRLIDLPIPSSQQSSIPHNDARTAIIAYVSRCPVEQDHQAVAKADEEKYVRCQPKTPR